MESSTLFGKYRIVQLLANGSGGEVFLAEHLTLKERRIIKRLYKNRPFYEERKKEAQVLKCLHHAAIPLIYDMEEDEMAMYIIEEYMGGETLKEFLMRKQILPQSMILSYSIQLCEIIEYLHQSGFLYLDMKPENLMVDGERLSLIDFGAAISIDRSPAVMFGTDGYAAPEQEDGEAERRTDVFGIGCVIGEMIANKESCGKELRKIYQNCVQKVPERRIDSVRTLKEELSLLYNGKKREGRKRKGSAVEYIGLIGAHEGADTMAFGAALAGYFREREQGRIAYIEMTGKSRHRELYQSLYGAQRSVPEEFSFCGIHFFSGSSVRMAECSAKGYSVIIMDFGYPCETVSFEGTPDKERLEEFYRCQTQFVVGDMYPWRLSSWKTLLRKLPQRFLTERLTAVVMNGECSELPVKTARVVKIPDFPDVMHPNKKTEKVFQKVIHSI